MPEPPIPICAFPLVHEKEAPLGFETKAGGVMVAPGQTVIGLNGPTVATGFTKASIWMGDPEHAEALGVMV